MRSRIFQNDGGQSLTPRQVNLARVPLNLGLALSAAWLLLSIRYAPGLGLVAAITAFAGFASAHLLHAPGRRVLATSLWMTGANLAVFIGSLSVHPDSGLIYMLTILTGLPFVVFGFSARLTPAITLAMLPPLLWALRFAMGEPPDAIYEVGAETARRIYAPIVAATIFGTLLFQVGYFTVLVRRYADRLRGARADAEQASRAKTAFLSGISHEMRTPLNGVIGLSDLVGDKARAGRDAQLAGYADGIRQSGEDLLRIVERTVEFAQLAGRCSPVPLRSVALAPLLMALVHRFQPQAERAGVTLCTDLDKNARPMVAPDLVTDAVAQLIDNALRYAGRGATVTVRTAREPGQVVIEVADTGPGFGAVEPNAPFTPFERLGQRSSASLGAGMGLPIARIKVEAMGGRIEILEDTRPGALVRITLPEAAQASRGITEAEQPFSLGAAAR